LVNTAPQRYLRDYIEWVRTYGPKLLVDSVVTANPKQVWLSWYARRTGGSPSGFNPYDSRWYPPEGWDRLYQFRDIYQVYRFAGADKWYVVSNPKVEEGILKLEPPEGGSAECRRFLHGLVATKISVAFKVNVVDSILSRYIISIFRIENWVLQRVAIETVPDDPSKIRLNTRAATIEFEHKNDWYLLEYDMVNKVAKVYNRVGDVVAEADVEESSTAAYDNTTAIYNRGIWDADAAIFKTYIDWFALKQPSYPGSPFDPNDPTWVPSEGWSSLWHFHSYVDLHDFTVSRYAVHDSLIVPAYVYNTTGYVEKLVSGVYASKIVLPVKIELPKVNASGALVSFDVGDGLNSYTVDIGVSVGNPNSLEITTPAGTDTISYDWSWILLEYDFANKIFRIYDKNLNTIYETSLTAGASTTEKYWKIRVEAACLRDVVTRTFSDWIAVKEAA